MKWRRSSHLLLSVLLAGAALAPTAFAEEGKESKIDVKNNTNAFNVINTSEIFKKISEAKKLTFDPVINEDEKVRVIVELAGETPLEFATKKNLLYKDLPQTTKDELQQTAQKKQTQVQNSIQSNGVNLEIEHSFTTVLNGFSGEVRYGDIEKIRKISSVKSVEISNEYKRPDPVPNMENSHGFIQSYQTWADAKYKGEGTIISIIDSGVDPSHKDFVLSDGTEEALLKEEVEALELDGKFFTEKVPYGYNYFDKNNEILDIGPEASMHGMHVAGTSAANGEIKGVAPEAQVLAMKVFSNDPEYPSTYDDIYIKAIDDSIALGADVINMSLGSTAAFYNEGDIANLAITKAVENGVVVSVSGGNSGHIGYGWGNPLAENPDIGVVGAPGLSKDSLQVAATGNVGYRYQHSFELDDKEFIGYGADDWSKFGGSIDIISLGGKLGHPEDYKGLDVKGKVVLVPRGDLTFVDKNTYATEAGAAGIIVYNNGNPVFYEDQGGWGLAPFMLVQTEVGAALEAAIKDAGGTLTLDLEQKAKTESPEMGRMTDFSSWGTTPSLELKPEISAPGGNIYSTLQNNSYGYMSGTSMAAPHVAGGSALVQQYLKKEFPNLGAEERTRFAKVLLMNTADVVEDLYGQPFSPRRQGAGMMQTFNAVSTPVTVVNKATNEAKVELKDFKEKQFSFTLVAKNHSNKKVTYDVKANVLTDTIQGDENTLIAGDMKGAKVTAPKTVTLKAGESKEITVNVDLTNAKIPGINKNGKNIKLDLKEDIFVEGFVTLEHATKPDLSVPYVGFYGNWDRPNIVDGFSDFDEKTYYDYTLMMDGLTRSLTPTPNKKIAVSPNGDGYYDEVQPLLSFLRNAKEVQYNIVGKDGKEIRRIKKEYDVRKTYFNAGQRQPYSYVDGRIWDGTIKGAVVQDGDYSYEIKAKVGNDSEWQTKRIPIVIDTIEPNIQVTHDKEKNTLTWETTEEGSGVQAYDIQVNGKSILKKGELLSPSTKEFKLPAEYENSFVAVAAVDYAMNVGFDEIVVGDEDFPVISLIGPEPLSGVNSHDVVVSGLVDDGTGVKELKVDGKPVEIKYDKELQTYSFETVVSYDSDGEKEVIIEATDFDNKSISIARQFFVDTTPGTITLNGEVPSYVNSDVTEYDLDVTLQDNYREMKFYVDDNFAYGIDFDVPLVMDGHTHQYTEKLALNEGLNTFVLSLTDLGGNKTKEVVNIYKLKEGEEAPSGHITSATVTPEVNVSENRPAQIKAEANEEITWDVTITDPNGVVTQLEQTKGTSFDATYAVAKDAANGVYTVTIGGKNAAEQEVDKVVEDFTVYNYSTLINSVKVLNAKGEDQSSFTRDGLAVIKADVTNLEAFNVSPMLILQVLDSENRVVGRSFLTMNTLNSNSTNGLGMQLPLKDLAKGAYKVEAFVWTGWDMNALAEAHKGKVTFTVE
ncbi:S8 family serine peptidase [Cytobacillus sp. FJAT-53684]|uniref:S8 family serine peptidase n=1 Tax=Cytobacillus mangrovibacter TaxID=3299024 RepID=A0ABW6K1Q2_9BACI